MGIFSRRKEKKARQYRSENAVDDPDPEYSKRKDPYLVIGDAPPRPMFAGKGLESNTEYQFRRESQDGVSDATPKENGRKPLTEQKDPVTPSQTGGKASKQNGQVADEKPGDTPAEPAVAAAKKGPGPVQPIIPDRPGTVIHVAKIFQALLLVYVLFLALFVKWLKPTFSNLSSSILLGAVIGILYSLVHAWNKRQRASLRNLLRLVPGRKGLRMALGEVPSWVAFQDKEKVEWLNRMLQGMWPYYDKAIGAAIKEAVEPMMEQYKPPGLIKKIYFSKLTFGDSPIRIDNVWVEDEGENHVLMEVAFRWAGDANIAIAIELPAGGEHTRMVPKVTDLQVAGVARVILDPLVPVIPGFGAAIIALRKPPLMHFRLDFGKAFGGSFTAKGVRLWLDPFIRETLTEMVVWPNRIVVPILPEEQAGPLDHLYLRHVGLLIVHVMEGRDLKKMDMIGKADPFLEMYTQPTAVEKTERCKKTLTPNWDEDKWLLVQEPKTQAMRLQCFDHDALNVTEMVSHLNPLKGIKDTFGAKTFMGRAMIPIRPFADRPGEPVTDWYDLGKGEWSNDDGTGKGEGQVQLRITYFPFELLYSKPRDASLGAVLVTVKKAADLPAADSNGLSDPYVKMRLDEKTKKTHVQKRTLSPTWNEKHEWMHVPVVELLEVTIWDSDDFTNDKCLGVAEIDIAEDVAKAPGGRIYKTWYLQDVPKDQKTKHVPNANITLQIQWVPFDFTF
ncbi:g172 [Coccomyxa viridis]|uniref:G172 protein n=1 Tax=Coccomyxa viridis TaxID=1274662 RepID=A0ABP1FGQ1_9CHLO